MIVALIPAAGMSRRMGQPKLALPYGRATILEATVNALRPAVAHVVVVIGPHVRALAAPAMAAGAIVLSLDEPTADMRETVLHGLDFIEHEWPTTSAILLAPADQPELSPNIAPMLIAAQTDDRILIPICGGRRGHPAIIPWSHVAGLRALPADVGLNHYFRADPARVREIDVSDSSILTDIDTPEDYRRLTDGEGSNRT